MVSFLTVAAIFAFYAIFLYICFNYFNGDCLANVVHSAVNSCRCQFCQCLSQIETLKTYVSFIGHGFLNSLFSDPTESGRVGINFQCL